MYLEAYSNTSKSRRMIVGFLDLAMKKGLLSPEEVRSICQTADDPILFNDAMNRIINKAVPPGEAIVLVDRAHCPDELECFCAAKAQVGDPSDEEERPR